MAGPRPQGSSRSRPWPPLLTGSCPEQSPQRCARAVLVDNSVLAELVSAVRAIGQTTAELEPLPDVLANQLLAMGASLPREHTELELPGEDELPMTEPVPTEPERPTIDAKRTIRRANPSSKPKRRRHGPLTAVTAILSMAVAIAAIVFVATRDHGQAPEQPDFVRNESNQPVKTVTPMVPEIKDGSDLQLVESDHDAPPPEPPRPIMDDAGDSDPPAVASMNTDSPAAPDKPAIDPVLPPAPSTLTKATELSGLRWNKITGILTRQHDSAATSQSRGKTWESVKEGPFTPLGDADRQVVLQTLPLSRAEAVFQSGGGLVLAGDSELEVSHRNPTASADVFLRHGDLALVDLPAGTLIRLIKAGHPIAVLQWQSKASAVLQHAAGGLEVHVHHGTINVNRRPQTDASVVIGTDRSVQSIANPRRLPTWVDRPVATINVKQTFLAQLADSPNVMGTINQQLRGLSDRSGADPQTIATLAMWQAALAGENVFRLVGHRIPVVRLSALDRVASLPSWDPRYARTWATIARIAGNQQRVRRFQQLCLLSQRQVAPNAAAVEAILGDLAAPDLASRAMSDYLLRRFYANTGRTLPQFDPTWTGNAQTRGVGLWRAYLGRSGNAAALRNQPAAAAAQRIQPAAAAGGQQRNQPAAQKNQPAAQRNQPAAGAVDRQR